MLVSVSGISASNPDTRTRIVFRFDDYILEPDIISDSIIYIFNKHKIPLCVGIIPYNKEGILYNNLNPGQLAALKGWIRKNEVNIALHGYNHDDNKLNEGSLLKKPGLSEFVSLSFNDQLGKIRRGKNAIDSLLNTNITIFIPPFNSYDDNTLKVLDSLKFKIISASIDGSSGSGKISYIPYTISDLNELPGIIRSNKNDNSAIIVVLHLYSFAGEYAGGMSTPVRISHLDTLLSWINDQRGLIATDFSTLGSSEVFDNERFDLNSTNKNMLIKTLNQLKIYRYGVFGTTEYLRKQKSVFGVLNILFHIVLFVSVYYAAILAGKMVRSYKMLRIFLVTLFIIGIMGVLYKALNSHSLTGYLVLLTVVSISFCLGMIRGNNLSSN